jgi:2-polyprenyl-6-methoxyphenol hydroxylase-like FAD-dependent oxidoreductase
MSNEHSEQLVVVIEDGERLDADVVVGADGESMMKPPRGILDVV